MARRGPRVTDPADQRTVWSVDGWVGEHDMLPAPPPPAPPWFRVVIAIAVVGCIVGGVLALTVFR